MRILPNSVLATVAIVWSTAASAQLSVPAQGWDGALSIQTDTTIDLSRAVDGDWASAPSSASWAPGHGIYDASKWAVVFHYTSVDVAAGATLTFANHPSGAPVVWLVNGDVDIAGEVVLDGERGSTGYPAEGGPGGFRGGNGSELGVPIGGGFGPGGALRGFGFDGSYATAGTGGAPTYGNEEVLPLIGGSGGSGNSYSGGGGGGAILVVSAQSVQVAGSVRARGGVSYDPIAGRGSGGAIRIVADTISGSGSLIASGGDSGAGQGRIRLEAVTQVPAVETVFPSASLVQLAAPATATIWPGSTDPALRIVSVNGIAVPDDPEGTLSFPWQDVALSGGTGDLVVVLEGRNVPANAVVNVVLTRLGGDRLGPLPAAFVSIAGSTSTWQITVPSVANGISALQARAVLP